MGTTIKDIAELAGVSYGTVSRVLNERSGVSPQTRARILEIMENLGYQPNAIARSLVTKQSYTLALVVPDISHPFFGSIALSVDKEAFRRGYNTVLCNTHYDLEIERSKLQFVQEKRVDGIIIKPAQEIIHEFADIGIPTVLISHMDEGNTSYIDIENSAGGSIAGEHLARCGYRKIAFVGSYREAASTRLRLGGLKKSLDGHGIALEESLVRFGTYTIDSGYRIMSELLESGNIPDAAFCGNDLIALGVLQRAKEAGIQVPRQLGVIGFDDGVMASLPQVNLTTIAQPTQRMGELATELLLKIIADYPNHCVQKITLRPELIVRATTAPRE